MTPGRGARQTAVLPPLEQLAMSILKHIKRSKNI
jgi:hypothetical protein